MEGCPPVWTEKLGWVNYRQELPGDSRHAELKEGRNAGDKGSVGGESGTTYKSFYVACVECAGQHSFHAAGLTRLA